MTTAEPTATAEQTLDLQQPPTPDAALRRFDRYIGTWELTGRTLDSDVDNVKGRTTFEYLPGGFFVVQRFEADFMSYHIQSLEVIGYDPATGNFPSTVYASMAGTPLPYVWEVEGDDLKITTDMLGATFHGKWNDDGTEFSGGWRPMPGREGPGNVPYDVWGRRAA